jgi:uncharacterized protein (DUF885 family)
MHGITRRTSLGALAVAVASPAFARKKRKAPPPDTGPFDDIGSKLLGHLRETGTYNGVPQALDGGPLARSLDDYSPAGEASLRAEFQAGRDLLMRIRFAGNDKTDTHLGVVSATLENGTRSAGITYGRINPLNFMGHSPYLISQISGPHIDGPGIMMEQQSLSTANAVDAWIMKLDSFPTAFAGVVEKLRADRAAGCVSDREAERSSGDCGAGPADGGRWIVQTDSHSGGAARGDRAPETGASRFCAAQGRNGGHVGGRAV